MDIVHIFVLQILTMIFPLSSYFSPTLFGTLSYLTLPVSLPFIFAIFSSLSWPPVYNLSCSFIVYYHHIQNSFLLYSTMFLLSVSTIIYSRVILFLHFSYSSIWNFWHSKFYIFLLNILSSFFQQTHIFHIFLQLKTLVLALFLKMKH